MEYVILGFLCIRALSQYDLYTALQKKVSPYYKASLGSIQFALKKLESKELISVEKLKENNRKKNIYTINETGKLVFIKWMKEDINENKYDNEVSTKIFFLGILKSEERILIVKKIITFLEAIVLNYDSTKKDVTNTEIPISFREIAKYQIKTLDLGIFYYKNGLEWFKNLLYEMENGK